MSGDLFDDPEVQAWFKHFMDDVLPNMKDSGVTIALWSGEGDPKQALELGYMIMLDKPIVVIAERGKPVPEKLQRVADAYMEYDPAVGPKQVAADLAPLLKSFKKEGAGGPG